MKEGYVVCNKCNGKGTLDANENPVSYVRPCPKCFGSGDLDWVENVVGKTPWGSKTLRGSLNDINVRRLMNYISKSLNNMASDFIFCPKDSVVNTLSSWLRQIQRKKAIDDYDVDMRPNGTIDIKIKPNRSIEYISITMNIP